ncbi:UDP-N-acetylmuramate dehydrogenase [Sulfuriferula sp.]|uniref:UDP-N-acetylmuramate dehydrogenase n=1 Tax=Sulfuriferula sp. TaxID=2025307 RepID=UPI00273020D5|nr:UDP-N-acetylmuramate dehydrogenase [Sulfuriferula sp.]MDP2024601.1 UDP-N-acetylmuramate dehydrogenase [Sulfuriferula sp.]
MRRTRPLGEDRSHHASGGGISSTPELRGEVRLHEPMDKHVSWRAGGVADRVYMPADVYDLAEYLRGLPATLPVYCVGLGSNLLVRDGGVQGVIVLLHGALKRIGLEARTKGTTWEHNDNDTHSVVFAEAGVAAPKLARFAATHDLVGAEFMAGIPGTVGGALAMNAGCYGSETWDIAAQVLTLNRQGHFTERSAADYTVGYRHVVLNSGEEEWYVGGWFRLPRGDGVASRLKIKDLLSKRIAAQPLGLPNAGSVFRNPPGDFAARLIEACGLKGKRIGGAQVSEKHANFIVNSGGATAADIENLIDEVEFVVNSRSGVRLVREVRIIGNRVAS